MSVPIIAVTSQRAKRLGLLDFASAQGNGMK